ncbi:uncharacterized protein LOC143774985 [Ranitomeya variabilis]|uniref:uncharacterized protein LOC143774985 n=1 Tax=Ranitomeya variabilis TaxID=490064 RepID=UPI0040571E1C
METCLFLQLLIPDTEDAEQMTCHSQGCDSTRESQCKKRAEKRNQIKKLTLEKVESSDDFETIKEETSQVPSKMGTVTEDTFLPPCKEIGDNDVPNIKAPMCNDERKTENEDKNKADNGNTTIKVATSERGDPLTQAGLDDTTTISGAKGAAEKQYKESRTEEESETEITTVGNVHKSKSKPEPMSDESCVCSGHGYTTNEEKADETNDSIKPLMSQLSPCEASSSTSVKNVLLSTQDLIGSLTSLKEKLGKHDKIRSVNTDNKQQCSSEDYTYVKAEKTAVPIYFILPWIQKSTPNYAKKKSSLYLHYSGAKGKCLKVVISHQTFKAWENSTNVIFYDQSQQSL